MDQSKTSLPSIWSLKATAFFRDGERLVTSIIGSKWSGPLCGIKHLLRTNFEDYKHGADTQCSALLQNLHLVARTSGQLCEEFVVGADNTVKETKNNCFLHWCAWLLCVLKDTCMWSMMYTSLITGHTHDSLDRFFALLRQALTGHDFYTLDDMWDLVLRALNSSETIVAAHVSNSWNWTAAFDAARLPRVHGHDLPRIHVFNVFRLSTGIWLKWRQYMTDGTWSRPVLLIGARKMSEIAFLRPTPQAPHFKHRSPMLNWTSKLESTLLDQMALTRSDGADAHVKERIAWLKQVIQHTHPKYNGQQSPCLEEIIADLRLIGTGNRGPVAPIADDGLSYADDMMVQHFPGSDLPVVPVDSLLRIDGLAAAIPEPPRCIMDEALLVCRPKGATVHGTALLFTLGRVLPGTTSNDKKDAVVGWLVPSMSPCADYKTGARRLIVDVFSEWVPLETLTVAESRHVTMPTCVVVAADVLIPNILLEADGTLPYKILDELRTQHGIDVSALSVSRTHKGNLFRAHVLSRAYS